MRYWQESFNLVFSDIIMFRLIEYVGPMLKEYTRVDFPPRSELEVCNINVTMKLFLILTPLSPDCSIFRNNCNSWCRSSTKTARYGSNLQGRSLLYSFNCSHEEIASH